jgi:dienelactone hydrolase
MQFKRLPSLLARWFAPALLCAVALVENAAAQGASERPVVYRLPAMENVIVKKDIVYKTVDGASLKMDVYYPLQMGKTDKLPLVIFNNGVGALEIPQWRVYQDWARLAAASGLIAVNYQSRPNAAFKDSEDMLEYLRQNAGALQIDENRIGLWSCSGNVNVGLPLVMQANRPYIRCAVIYYGMANVQTFRQKLPLLLVRAGQDSYSLNRAIDEFVKNALARELNLEFINYLEGQHAFDILDDNDRSRKIIKQTLDFLATHLTAKEEALAADETVLTATTFYNMMAQGQSDNALQQYRQAREKFSGHPFYHWVMQENGLNDLGYQLLQNNRSKEALEVMKINAANHPSSPNVFDSLGDIYEATGDTAMAIQNAKKALELLRSDGAALPENFRNAIQESAEGKLERLKKR